MSTFSLRWLFPNAFFARQLKTNIERTERFIHQAAEAFAAAHHLEHRLKAAGNVETSELLHIFKNMLESRMITARIQLMQLKHSLMLYEVFDVKVIRQLPSSEELDVLLARVDEQLSKSYSKEQLT